MRTVIFEPGQQWPRIVKLEDVSSLRVAVGGYLDVRNVYRAGHGLSIVTACDAESTGAAPNRIIDGHCLYGTIAVCGDGLKSLQLPVAKDLQSDNDDWPMVQVETVETKGENA